MTNKYNNIVYVKSKQRFNLCGQKIPRTLSETNKHISLRLSSRLFDYTTQRMKDMGLAQPLSWRATISTSDGDLPPCDRFYSVSWLNEQGTEIGISGILTDKGWPHLDHGCFINENQ